MKIDRDDMLRSFETFEMPEPAFKRLVDRRGRLRRRERIAAVVAAFAIVALTAGVLGRSFVTTTTPAISPSTEPTTPPSTGGSSLSTSLVAIDEATGAIHNSVVGNVLPGFRAAVSPDGSHVVFVRNVDGLAQLFMVGRHGASSRLTGRRMFGCGCGAFDPAWSPDGRRIVFSGVNLRGNQDLYVLDVGDGRISRLTRDDRAEGTPSWSPDGRTIAFARGGSTSGALWLLRVSDDTVRRLTPAMGATDPAWSPDGRSVAFSADDGSGSAVWLVQRDGSGVRRLASSGIEASPSWSPDGRELAFTGLRPTAQGGGSSIDVVDLATGQLREPATNAADPTWSPDGRTILVLRS